MQTTNLFAHVWVHHPSEAATLSQANTANSAVAVSQNAHRQPSILAAFAKGTKYKQETGPVHNGCCKISRKGGGPISHSGERDFQRNAGDVGRAVRATWPKIVLKHQPTIPKLYNKLRTDIVSDLNETHFIALTTDMCSSINIFAYMSITAHYVSEDWTFKSKCLETTFVPESHTAEVLAEALQEGLQAWGIACITTDNGAKSLQLFET